MAQTPLKSVEEVSPVAGGLPRSGGERSEPERSGGPPATAAPSAPPPSARAPAPDPEVVPKARRRTFTAEYKRRIRREADACTKPGQIGALLRREGLYSSHLSEWGRLRDRDFVAAAGATRRGRPAKPVDPSAKRVAELERENRRLSEQLRKAEIIIDFQKKLQALLSLQDPAGTP